MNETRSRREFVALSLSGIGAAILAAACGTDEAGRSLRFRPRLPADRFPLDPGQLQAMLGEFFGRRNLEAVRWVGRAYAQRFLEDTERLLRDLDESMALFELNDTDTSARLGAAIAGDFVAGRTVSVYGWQLAAAEARLATIVDLVLPEEAP